ncbi:hypothetical protein U1Q18_010127 [Sarracenia purpurea var. burkii]
MTTGFITGVREREKERERGNRIWRGEWGFTNDGSRRLEETVLMRVDGGGPTYGSGGADEAGWTVGVVRERRISVMVCRRLRWRESIIRAGFRVAKSGDGCDREIYQSCERRHGGRAGYRGSGYRGSGYWGSRGLGF